MANKFVEHAILVPEDFKEYLNEYEIRLDCIERLTTLNGTPCATFGMLLKKKKKYKFPDFLPRGWWLAMDDGEDWFIFNEKPIYRNGRWIPIIGSCEIVSKLLNWTPPVVSSPETSLMLIEY